MPRRLPATIPMQVEIAEPVIRTPELRLQATHGPRPISDRPKALVGGVHARKFQETQRQSILHAVVRRIAILRLRAARHLLARVPAHGPSTSMEGLTMVQARIVCVAGLGVMLGATVAAQEAGRWTAGPKMPSERTEIAAAEVAGRIYVVGGFGGERELEIFDPAAARWSRGALIPRPVHHAAAVGHDGKLYVSGGYVDGW